MNSLFLILFAACIFIQGQYYLVVNFSWFQFFKVFFPWFVWFETKLFFCLSFFSGGLTLNCTRLIQNSTNPEKDLMDNLLKNYDPKVRPVAHVNDTLIIDFDIALQQILNFVSCLKKIPSLCNTKSIGFMHTVCIILKTMTLSFRQVAMWSSKFFMLKKQLVFFFKDVTKQVMQTTMYMTWVCYRFLRYVDM